MLQGRLEPAQPAEGRRRDGPHSPGWLGYARQCTRGSDEPPAALRAAVPAEAGPVLPVGAPSRLDAERQAAPSRLVGRWLPAWAKTAAPSPGPSCDRYAAPNGRRSMDRRAFLKTTAAGGAGLTANLACSPTASESALGRRRAGRDPAVRVRRDHRGRPPGNDGVGRTHRPLHHRGLSRAPRSPGPAGSGAALDDRDQPGCARYRGRARRRASGQRTARAAPRHSGRAQGQPRHPRPDDHHGGVAGARRLHPAAGLLRGRNACAPPARSSWASST